VAILISPPSRTIGLGRVTKEDGSQLDMLYGDHLLLVGREIHSVVFQAHCVNEWLAAVSRLYTPSDHRLSLSKNRTTRLPGYIMKCFRREAKYICR